MKFNSKMKHLKDNYLKIITQYLKNTYYMTILNKVDILQTKGIMSAKKKL